MKRVLERLRQIGPHPLLLVRYVAHHVGTRVHLRRLRRSYDTLVASVPEGATLRTPSVGLASAEELPAELRPGADRIRREADAAMRHEADLLGSGPVELGAEIDWHRDFKSGHVWPPAFYLDVAVTRLDDASDAKVPWELSRGHHLLTLARAARIWRDEACADELERQLRAWLDANPTGTGINWTNPMEVAIRAVNWVWAIATVEERRPLDPALRADVTRSLQAHARHVAENLEGSPWLRSNHYVADVVGLAVLGCCLEGDAAARRWRETARTALEREITTQVYPEGLAFEASLPYHGLVLELFLVARHVFRWAGAPLSAAYDERLRAMLDATRAVRHPDGRLPQIGDADSGRILPAGTARPATADHLLWLGAAELGTAAPLDGPAHEEVAWTFGLARWEAVGAESRAAAPTRTSFPRAGIFVLANDRLHAVVRCGDVGQNGNGGHAHNDTLSFELSLDGRPLLLDSGTYVYTSDPRERNAFRGTAAHSTVVVAGEEINPIDPTRLFELEQASTPKVTHVGDGRLVAEHDGYRRLATPTVHRRSFALDAARLIVEDELLGTGRQVADAYVHLAPGAVVAAEGDGRYAIAEGGRRAAVLSIRGADSVAVESGWVSSSFGSREPAPVLRARLEGDLPLRLTCEIETVEGEL